MTTRHGKLRFKAALLCMSVPFSLAVPEIACAQANESELDFNVPAQPLARSLSAIAERANIQVVYPDREPLTISAPAVRGRMTPSQAISAALAGSGYSWRWLRPGVVTLVSSQEGTDGERVTGSVRVEGAQGSPYNGGAGQMAGVNGINGSRDITATEGTGSFTTGALTIGSKTPRSIQDTPQSVSALTHEQLEQQNINDYETALKQLPGVSFAQGETSLQTTFYSRGFEVTSFQVDGGAPLSTSVADGQGFYPQIDLSVYDHVELLRGAAGRFGSYGQPGGVINLVRKKPLDDERVSLELEVGSWNHYRTVLDASAPLAFDGRLRGRAVATWQSNEHFYNLAEDEKTLLYGILEYDLTPSTLVTVGASHTNQDSRPWFNGLPRYLTGADLELPRDTSFVFPWNRWDFETTEFFAGLEQQIGSNWTLRFNLTHNEQASTRKLGYSSGAVNPENNLGPQLSALNNDYASAQLSADASLSGSFTFLGQNQELTFGISRVESDGGGLTIYENLINTFLTPYVPYPGSPVFCQDFGAGVCPTGSIPSNPPVNVYAFDPADPLYSEPRTTLPIVRYPTFGTVQSSAYLSMRLTALDRLHLDASLRWSRQEYEFVQNSLCTSIPATDPGFSPNCFDRQIGDVYFDTAVQFVSDDFSWPPSVSLSYDILDSLTAYVGYTDIYQNQANLVDVDRKPLPPVTGSNWEGGLKWAARDGTLNITLAAYHIEQKGFGMVDPPDYSQYFEVSPGVYCCFVVNPDQTRVSEGIDVEAAGQPLPGWQISASYSLNNNRSEGPIYGAGEGKSFLTISPRHLYKLWTSYDLASAGLGGRAANLTLSAGVNGQSKGYRSGSICVNFAGPPDPVTGAQSCASFAPPDYVPYEFTVEPYAILSARIDYRMNDRWSLALHGENLTDETYYQTTGDSVTLGHWYGPPRSFTLSLSARW